VIGLINAFQQGQHLRLRPDDVWLAILTQFRIYCDTYLKAVPGLSIGQKVGPSPIIHVLSDPSDSSMDLLNHKVAFLAKQTSMSDSFKDLMEPCFSTTTDTDKAVASVVMLGKIRKRVDGMCLPTSTRPGSGLGAVTILGTPKDWHLILNRIKRLSDFKTSTTDAAVTTWISQLTGAVGGIYNSSHLSTVGDRKEFWDCACRFDGIDSTYPRSLDRETMTGWITAFCFWSWGGCLNAKYDWMKRYREQGRQELFREDVPYATTFMDRRNLAIGTVNYHHIFPKSIPNAVASLSINLFDHSLNIPKLDVTVVAGAVGATVFQADDKAGEETFVQPRSGWWMLDDEHKLIELGYREGVLDGR
jgi:hypothetical protein